MFANGRNAAAESQNYFPHPHFFRNTRTTAPRRRAAAGEALFQGEVRKNKGISPYKTICPAYQKTGQPPWVARFFDDMDIMDVFICDISAVTLAFD